jgi:cyanophycin synthetase
MKLAGSSRVVRDAALRSGRPGRAAAMAVDLVREVGVAPMWRQWRARHTEVGPTPATYRAMYRRIWEDAARQVGAEVTALGDSVLEIGRGSRRTRVIESRVMLDSAVALEVSEMKPLVHRLVRAVGVPVPEHVEFDWDEPAAARRFLAACGGPCVVKPAYGTRGGEGVTPWVTNPHQLELARTRARRYGHRLLVERQALGTEYRLLFLDGHLLDAIRREPPTVVGDGRSSVADLMAALNRDRTAAPEREGFGAIGTNLDVVLSLTAQGLGLSSVPPAGATVHLAGTANASASRDNHVARGQMGADLVAMAAAAVRVVGLRLAAVELVTAEPAERLAAPAAVLEINGHPGLHYHYQVAEADQAVPVAVPVLERLLEEAQASG